MNKNMKIGRLELIIGPMYASKSTEVICRVKRYRSKNLKVMIINHSINNRYGSPHITTHDSLELECSHIVDKLEDIWNNYNEDYLEADIIAIEELQFFPDAFNFVTTALDKDHKNIVAAGLISNYRREKFGQVLDLIPHAEEILHLKAYCALCDDIKEGAFTKLIYNNNDGETKNNIKNDILVGSKEKYITVCRYHYLN